MKKPDELKEIQSTLTASEIKDLEWLTTELTTFLENREVSGAGVINLENMMNTLNNFRRTYTQRVIRLHKLGHMVD